MRKLDVWAFYWSAKYMQRMTSLQTGRPLKELTDPINGIAQVLGYLYANPNPPLVLRESLAAATDLLQYVLDLEAVAIAEPDRLLSQEESQRAYTLWTRFEIILQNECANLHTYLIPQKLGYDTTALISSGVTLLGEEARAIIPPEAIEDMNQAGRCLAFDIATATGFHVIRATESVIRLYYKKVTGSLLAKKNRNWGAYIKGLRAANADEKITAFLDHIRESYRNPITHPEETLTPEEAQNLLGVCVSAISQMAAAIRKLA
jgi:hypothetical protein